MIERDRKVQRVAGAYAPIKDIGKAGCRTKRSVLYGENRRSVGAKLGEERQGSRPLHRVNLPGSQLSRQGGAENSVTTQSLTAKSSTAFERIQASTRVPSGSAVSAVTSNDVSRYSINSGLHPAFAE